MHYLDTSLIVAALCREVATPAAQQWLAAHDASSLLTSDWTVTEFSSALSVKVRTGQLSLYQRAEALAAFNAMLNASIDVLPVNAAQFRAAARFADHHRLALRGADALHLAVAAEYGATVHTLVRALAAAGPQLGIPTELL